MSEVRPPYIKPNWRQEEIKGWGIIKDFLKAYRWSSLLDYININNFPSVIKRDFLQKYFKSHIEYQEFIGTYLVTKDTVKINEITLDECGARGVGGETSNNV